MKTLFQLNADSRNQYSMIKKTKQIVLIYRILFRGRNDCEKGKEGKASTILLITYFQIKLDSLKDRLLRILAIWRYSHLIMDIYFTA